VPNGGMSCTVLDIVLGGVAVVTVGGDIVAGTVAGVVVGTTVEVVVVVGTGGAEVEGVCMVVVRSKGIVLLGLCTGIPETGVTSEMGIVGKINSCLGSKMECGSFVPDVSLTSSGDEVPWTRTGESESDVLIGVECLITDGSIGWLRKSRSLESSEMLPLEALDLIDCLSESSLSIQCGEGWDWIRSEKPPSRWAPIFVVCCFINTQTKLEATLFELA
jgi:hypothetical protein